MSIVMKGEPKKRLFSKQNIVSLFIVFIMVSSVIGYMWGRGTGEKVKYKDYSFLRKGRAWVLKTQNGELAFDHFPSEIENINLSSETIDRLKGVVEIDSTSSINSSYAEAIAKAQYDMQQVLGTVSNTYIRVGLTDENEFNLPVIICKDSTYTIPVLHFKKSNSTNILIDGDCIIGEAKSEIDILRIKDRILYGLLGII